MTMPRLTQDSVYTDPVGHPFCLCRHEGVTWTDKRVVWP
jgi:hypothetical protein